MWKEERSVGEEKECGRRNVVWEEERSLREGKREPSGEK